MPKQFPRVNRIALLLQREIAQLISKEFKDPRIGFITVTAVEVSTDYSVATVFITVLQEEKIEVSLKVLNEAAGFLRSSLSQKLVLRSVPRFRFEYDPSIVQGNRISKLIDSVTIQPNNE